MAKPAKSNWVVRLRCVVTKVVYAENCTEEQAAEDPWAYSVNEDEISQEDWKVLRITEDK
jgi:hypothetical protein